MAEISLCMIVRNEEAVLARCLDSVQDLVDEIVIVDTGSTDATREIAARYTTQIYEFPWIDDFAAARNFAFSKGTREYLMWLDADDVLEAPDRAAFAEAKRMLAPSVDVVMMPYHVAFDEADRPVTTFARERVLRRAAGFTWQGAVHEVITPAGEIVHWDAAVSHRKIGAGDPDRNLRIFERLLREGHAFEPRERFYYARELAAHAQHAQAIEEFTAFLASDGGWSADYRNARLTCADCYDQRGQPQQALTVLLGGLADGRPCADLCCALGARFAASGDYPTAIFWYEAALHDQTIAQGFVAPACYDYIPLLQLCMCYDRQGDRVAAIRYHKRARILRPDDPSVQHNEAYFAEITQKN